MKRNSLNLSLYTSSSSSFPGQNELYLKMRKELLSIVKRINTHLCYSSATFYLSICYMDLISENIKYNEFDIDYYLIALSCLSLASKYNEKDPLVSKLHLLCSAMNEMTKCKNAYTTNDLKQCEVFSIKTLNYNLNHSTLYDFVVFFFVHGSLLESQLSSQLSFDSIKKYLENAYVYSRDIIDRILEDSNIVFKYNSIDLAIVAIKLGVTIAFGTKYGDQSYGVDAIFTHCYSYEHQSIQNELATLLQSIIIYAKETPNQKHQPKRLLTTENNNYSTNKPLLTHHKRQLSNIKHPNIFSSLLSRSNTLSNKKESIILNKLMEQVSSSNKDILDKTKRLFQKHLVYNNTIQEMPKTIIINNNININIQKQISGVQLKSKKNNERVLESNENINSVNIYNSNKSQRVINDIDNSTRIANKNIDLYRLINVNSNSKPNKNSQAKHCFINLEKRLK